MGHRQRRALSQLYFNSSASGQLVGWLVGWLVGRLVGQLSVGQSTIRVPGLWEVSLEKEKQHGPDYTKHHLPRFYSNKIDADNVVNDQS